MAIFYADSSVLVKRHIQAQGSVWFRYLTASRAGNRIETVRLSMIEVISALNRRVGRNVATDGLCRCAR